MRSNVASIERLPERFVGATRVVRPLSSAATPRRYARHPIGRHPVQCRDRPRRPTGSTPTAPAAKVVPICPNAAASAHVRDANAAGNFARRRSSSSSARCSTRTRQAPGVDPAAQVHDAAGVVGHQGRARRWSDVGQLARQDRSATSGWVTEVEPPKPQQTAPSGSSRSSSPSTSRIRRRGARRAPSTLADWQKL